MAWLPKVFGLLVSVAACSGGTAAGIGGDAGDRVAADGGGDLRAVDSVTDAGTPEMKELHTADNGQDSAVDAGGLDADAGAPPDTHVPADAQDVPPADLHDDAQADSNPDVADTGADVSPDATVADLAADLLDAGSGDTVTSDAGDAAAGETGDAADDVAPTDASDAADATADALVDTETVDAADVLPDVEPFGPCQTGKDCPSGVCVLGPDGMVCTQACLGGDCPKGWQCMAVSADDPSLVCTWPHRELCEPCGSDADCEPVPGVSSRCVPWGDAGSFCGTSCAADDECPEGFKCSFVTVADGQTWQCMPLTEQCTCFEDAIAEAASTLCVVANANGSCKGVRQCGPDGLSPCSAATPAPESCDGVDNDCDGVVDPWDSVGCVKYYSDKDSDGYGMSTCVGICSCTPGPTPVHTAVNKLDCDDGSFAIKPGAPEKCDNVDNDCDGQTDPEGSAGCSVYYKDQDKDGYGDDVVAPQCLCLPSDVFDALNALDCDDSLASVKPGMTEKCDGLDNNCDGETDPEGSLDCKPFYKDADKDGAGDQFGTSKCLCSGAGEYTAVDQADCNDANPAVPNCVGKDCGDSGCGKPCGFCTGSLLCAATKCRPETMVRTATSCPPGYTQAGSWYTGPGPADGKPDGKGFEQDPVDAGWMALCTMDPTEYKVVVQEDDCPASPHTYLGCQPGFVSRGRWHVGQGTEGAPCAAQSGVGYDNGSVQSGWMELCVKSAISTAAAQVLLDECTNTAKGCPAGWLDVGEWKPSRSLCNGAVEAECSNGSIDAGWLALCVSQ
jgi:hypothetical protein